MYSLAPRKRMKVICNRYFLFDSFLIFFLKAIIYVDLTQEMEENQLSYNPEKRRGNKGVTIDVKIRKRQYATIGNGLEIKKSLIEGAGNGLFATRDFKKGEIITIYEGETINREKADELARKGLDSHIRSLCLLRTAIDGIKNPKEAFGKGGASFCNDASYQTDFQNNSKFAVNVDRHTGKNTCFLKALKDIYEGDEVFASYGNDYWRRIQKRKEREQQNNLRYKPY